jgi:hypothetical protein
MHLRWLGPVLLVACLVGCEDEPSESTCTLALASSGDFSAELTKGSSVGCTTLQSSGAGIDVTYTPVDDPAIASVDLVIDEVTKGQTGADFPATVTVHHDDGRAYTASDCTVAIDGHESRGPAEFGETFAVHGTGTCASAATESGGGNLTLGSFEFDVQVTWAD